MGYGQMKDLVIFGAGGHCRSALSIAASTRRWNVLAVIDVSKEKNPPGERIMGIPVFHISEWERDKIIDTEVFIAIGGNKERMSFARFLGSENITTLIHESAQVDESAIIDVGCLIGANAHIGPCTRVGAYTIINNGANLEHESTVGDYCHAGPGSVICGRVKLQKGVMIGANSTILPGLIVEDWTTLGAGSVLTKSIVKPGDSYVGVPAKKL